MDGGRGCDCGGVGVGSGAGGVTTGGAGAIEMFVKLILNFALFPFSSVSSMLVVLIFNRNRLVCDMFREVKKERKKRESILFV